MKSTIEATKKKGNKNITDTKPKSTSRDKIILKIYNINKTLPREQIQDAIDLNTDDIISNIYILKFEGKATNNLDKIFDTYEKELTTSDVVEIENKDGLSRFYYLGLFGFEEIEFDKNLINKK